jgi:DNA replication licensing factor MCM2
MLARFVVDSHARSQPKGANLEDRVTADMDDDPLAAARQADPDVRSLAITTEKLFSILCF